MYVETACDGAAAGAVAVAEGKLPWAAAELLLLLLFLALPVELGGEKRAPFARALFALLPFAFLRSVEVGVLVG